MADSSLEATVPETIARFGMILPGELVVVAVSGGPDSVALLHGLHGMGIRVHVAHLNHMFRGGEAEEDARFVRALAESLGVPATIRAFDVPAYLEATGKSAQEGAREVRYAFLEEVADETGAARIAVGHTADDLVETVLINLLRGSGVDGLRGIPPVRGRIVRPLIDCWRREIVDYCRRHGLAPREDSSNQKPAYFRNQIRLELVPVLEAKFKPDIRPILARMAGLMRDDSEYLTAQANAALDSLLCDGGPDRVEIDRAGLMAQPLAISRRVIREAIRRIEGSLSGIGFETVEEILIAAGGALSFKINLPGNLFAEGTPTRLLFYRPGEAERAPSVDRELSVPGVTVIPELGLVIDAKLIANSGEMALDQGPWVATLDWDRVSPPLVVRNRRPGDRFTPLGMAGSRKLHDFLVDRKVPRERRDRVALISDREGILWVAGFVIAEKAGVTESTTRLLQMCVIPETRLPDVL